MHQDSSESLKMTGTSQTYLVEAEDHSQRSHRGSESSRTRRVHKHAQSIQKDAKAVEDVNIPKGRQKPPNSPTGTEAR